MSEAAVVEVEGIRKSFSGVEVLHGVALTATGGSVLALLGENGAGKSTLMKILVGDYAPDSGRVTFDGRDITGATPLIAAAAGIRMVFQELSDAPPLTVTENICLGRWPKRRGRVDWRVARAQAVERAGSAGVRHRPRSSRRIPPHRRASGRRDRQSALGQRTLSDPRRADGRAVRRRVRPAVRDHSAVAGGRCGDHLHHPSPRRGSADRRPSAGPARRGDGARRRCRRPRP